MASPLVPCRTPAWSSTYMRSARLIWVRLLMQSAFRADCSALSMTGISNAARMAMTAITTSSSTRVNPFFMGGFSQLKPTGDKKQAQQRLFFRFNRFRIFEFMAEYKVQFEVFEGPLDLLLYLIKKEEVDIYEVNLTKLATQFIEYIDTMRLLDLEIAGEFLVMAATLMYIKSRELLPVEQQVVVEGEEEEGEDPRWELIRQ